MSNKCRHKRLSFICHRCGKPSDRQIRRIVDITRPLCVECLRANKGGLKYIPTTKLKEIINLEGVSRIGTDYEELLPELKEILWEREIREQEKALTEYQNNSEYIDNNDDVPF